MPPNTGDFGMSAPALWILLSVSEPFVFEAILSKHGGCPLSGLSKLAILQILNFSCKVRQEKLRRPNGSVQDDFWSAKQTNESVLMNKRFKNLGWLIHRTGKRCKGIAFWHSGYDLKFASATSGGWSQSGFSMRNCIANLQWPLNLLTKWNINPHVSWDSPGNLYLQETCSRRKNPVGLQRK